MIQLGLIRKMDASESQLSEVAYDLSGLVSRLEELAQKDPYFREEHTDWGLSVSKTEGWQ